MHPRRPHGQRRPSSRTTTWPISRGDPRPVHGLPSSTMPPPTPVPQNTPEDRAVLLSRAERELGVGRDLHVVADVGGHAQRRGQRVGEAESRCRSRARAPPARHGRPASSDGTRPPRPRRPAAQTVRARPCASASRITPASSAITLARPAPCRASAGAPRPAPCRGRRPRRPASWCRPRRCRRAPSLMPTAPA